MSNQEPPRSEAAERAVIGTVLVAASECLADISDLTADDFFVPAHHEAWECVRALQERGAQVNAISVQDEARARGIVASFPDRETFAIKLAAEAVPVEHVLGHAKTIRKMATLRRLIVLCVNVQTRAHNMVEVDDVLADLREGLFKLEGSGSGAGPERVCDLIDATCEGIQARAAEKSPRVGKVGIVNVDRILGGFRPGHLIVVGGLPGMGKTAAMTGILAHNCANHLPCCLWSLEMDRHEIIERVISLRSQVPATNISRGSITFADWNNAIKPWAKKIAEYPFWLDDRVLSANQIFGEANRWFAKHVRAQGRDFGIIAIDYLNLVRSDEDSETRNRELAKIVAKFKTLAKQLRIPVILLAQLNRKVTERGGEPTMFDFRDCGEIESMADVIMCPWREDLLKPPANAPKPFEATPARWLILKHKSGAIGAADIQWHRERMEYTDPAGVLPEEPRPHWTEEDDS